MEVFVRAEIPETCYINEAAHWVAFGVVPSFYPDDKSGNDLRGIAEEHLDQLEANVEVSYLDLCPFIESIFPKIDVKKFTDYMLSTGSTSPEKYRELINSQQLALDMIPRINNPPLLSGIGSGVMSIMQDYKDALPKSEWLSVYIDDLDRLVEIGQSKIFSALAEGSLSARGIRCRLEKNENAAYPYSEIINGDFANIESREWRSNRVDWEKANLSIPGDEWGWVATQVLTENLFQLFPRSLLGEMPASAQITGGALILNKEANASNAPRASRKGRRRIGDGVVEDALVREFERRSREGRLPDKSEAVLQEAIDWVNEIFGKDVSRSSVQRYLKGILLARRGRL